MRLGRVAGRLLQASAHAPASLLPSELQLALHDITHNFTALTASATHILEYNLSNPRVDHLPGDYKLVREADYDSWYVFIVVFIILILFDNLWMHRSDEPLTFTAAVLYSLFWVGCALLFCAYVYFARSPEDAYQWWVGYLLEWMLSVDNLFVFQSIFKVMGTPDDQKHKPLFWGIVGAVVFRMAFFVVEELLVHRFTWMYFVLGLFLLCTGIKVLQTDDEDDANSVTESSCVKGFVWLFPVVDAYAPTAKFFAVLPVDRRTNVVQIPDDWIRPREPGSPLKGPGDLAAGDSHETVTEPAAAVPPDEAEVVHRIYATKLFLVVVVLEATDVLFAVDSVSAIVAQIPDLFLAYTACVFAMLGLRATFFVVDELVKLFFLLSYAVAGVLMFLGVKLMLRPWIHIPSVVVCTVLVSVVSLSIIASVVYRQLYAESMDENNHAVASADQAAGAPGAQVNGRP